MIASMSPEELERRLVSFFAHDPRGAAAAYLFGSYARRAADETSDADVAVLFRTTPASTLDAGPLDLEADLDRLDDLLAFSTRIRSRD